MSNFQSILSQISVQVPSTGGQGIAQKIQRRVKHTRNRLANRSVLFWVPGGMSNLLHVEGALAAALGLRGVKVHAIICDGPYQACVKRAVGENVPLGDWHLSCAQCKSATQSVLNKLAISHSFIGDYVPSELRAKLKEVSATVDWGNVDELTYEGINIGGNVRSSILRYLQGMPADNTDDILREYAFSALVNAAAVQSALDQHRPDSVVLSHGVYVDWGPALRTALNRNVPVFGWCVSYLPAHFYFRQVDDAARKDFRRLSNAGWDVRKRKPLSDVENKRLDKFLEDRYQNEQSFDLRTQPAFNGEVTEFREKYGLLPGKPVWGVMSHLTWDAVSDSAPMAYASFEEWILDTIEEAISIQDVNWLIKVHPSEGWHKPAKGVLRMIEDRFPQLPEHVKVIPSDEPINTWDFYSLIDGGVTVLGTGGLELALLGKPVIIAGEAHYGSKGFTHDGYTKNDYKAKLKSAVKLSYLTDQQRQWARQYAYSFFVQRQIPLPVVKDPKSIWWSIQLDKLHLLQPGEEPFMDFVCEQILNGGEFVLGEKMVALSEAI